MHRRVLNRIVMSLTLVAFSSMPALAQDAFYKGKTVRIIVGASEIGRAHV